MALFRRKAQRAVHLTLIGKPECHLCDDARQVLNDVLKSFPATQQQCFIVEELSILDDEKLRERYWEEIPVLLINGRVHDYWRLNPERLQPALEKALTA